MYFYTWSRKCLIPPVVLLIFHFSLIKLILILLIRCSNLDLKWTRPWRFLASSFRNNDDSQDNGETVQKTLVQFPSLHSFIPKLAKIQYALSYRPNTPKNCGNKLYLLNRSANEHRQPLTVRLLLLYSSLYQECHSSYCTTLGSCICLIYSWARPPGISGFLRYLMPTASFALAIKCNLKITK